MLAVVQLAVVLRDQFSAIEAARVAARAAAVSADPQSAASTTAMGIIGARGRVSVAEDGDVVTVLVDLVNGTDVPLIGLLLPDVEIRGRASMIFEPP